VPTACPIETLLRCCVERIADRTKLFHVKHFGAIGPGRYPFN
jgi:hypothetical protein